MPGANKGRQAVSLLCKRRQALLLKGVVAVYRYVEFEIKEDNDGVFNLTKCEKFILSLVNNSCVNTSDEFYDQKEHDDYATWIFVTGIITKFKHTVSPLGLIMNILNIVAIANAPSRLTPHSRLVINLAVSDMCILLPWLLHILIFESTDYGIIGYPSISYFCYKVAVETYFLSSVKIVSLLNLLGLAIDHNIAIVKLLHYYRIVSNSRTKAYIVMIWLISFIKAVIESIPTITKYTHGKKLRNTSSPIFKF